MGLSEASSALHRFVSAARAHERKHAQALALFGEMSVGELARVALERGERRGCVTACEAGASRVDERSAITN